MAELQYLNRFAPFSEGSSVQEEDTNVTKDMPIETDPVIETEADQEQEQVGTRALDKFAPFSSQVDIESGSSASGKPASTGPFVRDEIQAPDADNDGTLTLKELSQDKNFMAKVEKYYTNRVEMGARNYYNENETDEEYLKRFMTNHYRAFMYNDMYLGAQIDYLSRADEETQILFGDVFSTIEDKAPMLHQDEMDGERWGVIADALWYGGTSVSNLATIAVSGLLGTAAGPVGTAAGVSAGVAAVRASSTAAIRNALLKVAADPTKIGKMALTGLKEVSKGTGKVIASKRTPLILGTSAGIAATEDVMLQNVERMGRVDPLTGEYDPTKSPEDFELSYLRAGITGVASGALEGLPAAVGSYAKLKNYKSKRENDLARINQAHKDRIAGRDAQDAVTTTPTGGAVDISVIQLAKAADDALKGSKAESLKAKMITDDFAVVDNVPAEIHQKALESLQNSEIFEKIGRISVQFQKDLDKEGMLDVIGETAAATYRNLRPTTKGTKRSRITAVIADGLNGMERLLNEEVVAGKGIKERAIRAWQESSIDMGSEQSRKIYSILEESLQTQGIDKKDFLTFMSYYTNGAVSIGDITRKSMNAAAGHMYVASKIRRDMFGEVYPNVDPEMRKVLENYMVGDRSNKVMSAMETSWDALKTLDRVRVGSLTTQLVTTARNIMSGGMMVAGQTGVNFIDSALYQLGRGLQNSVQGNFSLSGIGNGIGDVLADSYSVINGVISVNKSQTLIDATMQYTPSLHKQLIRNQPDIQVNGSNKFARYANKYIETINHFNMASDSFYRRAFYMSSLDKRFKRFLRDYKAKTGRDFDNGQIKNVMQYVESGRVLDKKLITGATEDALKMTFASNPESSLGRSFLQFMEITRPVSSAVMPFPRFFANSLRTMYEYSAFNPMVKTFDKMLKGEMKELAGDEGREAFAKATIGTASTYFMLDYLSNKEDNTPWYDVGGVDIRAMWPLSAYGAIAEAIIHANQENGNPLGIQERNPRKRTDNDIRSYIETLSGIPLRGGEQASRVLSGVYTSIFGEGGSSVDNQKVNDRMLEFATEFFGGYLTPLRMSKDIADEVSANARYKDIRAGIEDADVRTKVAARIANTYLPENIFGYDVQEPLPVSQYIFDNAEKMRRAPIARFIGVTFNAETSALEREMARIGVKRQDLLPYSGSARVDNRRARNFSHHAVDGLKSLLSSEAYNSDIGPDGRKLTETQKLKYQKDLVTRRSKFYRDFVKNVSASEAAVEADAKSDAMQVKIAQLKKNNADTETLDKAYQELAVYELHHISSDEMKIQWDGITSREDAADIEQEFRERHEAAVKKAERGEYLSAIDYMYLRGPTILEQRSYGLAVAHSKIMGTTMGVRATDN